jgi:hypothetical protein
MPNNRFLAYETFTGRVYNFNAIFNIVTDLFIAFLGNGSVNMFQCATVKDVSQWTDVIARC